MHHSQSVTINTNRGFETSYSQLAQLLLMAAPVRRLPAHATQDESMAIVHELLYLTQAFSVDEHSSAWAEVVRPNLPWAEDHFKERVGGMPLNPAPSEAWWPYARAGNAEHKKDEKFSHTYPERFWPKYPEVGYSDDFYREGGPLRGIRFPYGDLNDVITLLRREPGTRQAYLPIWFPEDAYAASQGERVPCSMGYHFLLDPTANRLDCVYTMRSCDIVRFYRDDIYMAGRLLEWVARRSDQKPGKLVVHIDNLHAFTGDKMFLEAAAVANKAPDKRAGYNFDALG